MLNESRAAKRVGLFVRVCVEGEGVFQELRCATHVGGASEAWAAVPTLVMRNEI